MVVAMVAVLGRRARDGSSGRSESEGSFLGAGFRIRTSQGQNSYLLFMGAMGRQTSSRPDC